MSDSVDFFYPAHSTYQRTFARIVPTSAQEAKALVQEMQSEHVTSLYVSDDGQRYGQTVASEVRAAARAAGLQIAAGLASASGAFYGGNAATPASRVAAAAFLNRAASANAGIHLFATSGLYDSSFVQTLSAAARSKLVISSPGFTSAKLPPAGAAFVSAFTAAYHHAPAPQAVFGYEAMKALLSRAEFGRHRRDQPVRPRQGLPLSEADRLGDRGLHDHGRGPEPCAVRIRPGARDDVDAVPFPLARLSSARRGRVPGRSACVGQQPPELRRDE